MIISLYASLEVSCGMLPRVCKARIYKLCKAVVFSPLSAHCETIFSRDFQGGNVTFGNTLCTLKEDL